jgi:hypothetical protein
MGKGDMMNAKSGCLALFGIVAFLLGGLAGSGEAGVSVNIGIGAAPPAYVVPAPPPVVPIPGTYVYYAPGLAVDILFYHGNWYRPYGGYWYRSRSYNGPWAYLTPTRVPQVLVMLPPDYRSVPRGYRHISYEDLYRNWGRWERERYWDRHEAWRDESRDHRNERAREWDRRHEEADWGHRDRDR